MPLVIVGSYEHHSNEVSFRESLAQVKRVKHRKDGLIDLEHLENILEKNKRIETMIVTLRNSLIIAPDGLYMKCDKKIKNTHINSHFFTRN